MLSGAPLGGGGDVTSLMRNAGVPIDTPLRELAKTLGIRKHRFYDWDVIEIAGAALPVEQICPLWINCIGVESDLLPADAYFALIGREPSRLASLLGRSNARDNHEAAEQALSRWLGLSTPDRTSANVICHRWYSDDFAIRLTTWPADLNREFPIPVADANPILRETCHLAIHDNRLPVTTPLEAQWLQSYAPVLLSLSGVHLEKFERSELGSVRGIARRMPAWERAQPPMLALSSDGEALRSTGIDACLILPRSIITGLHVLRLKPAKGPGGGYLSVKYRDLYSSSGLDRSLSIASTQNLYGINALSEHLATWARRPLIEVEDYDV